MKIKNSIFSLRNFYLTPHFIHCSDVPVFHQIRHNGQVYEKLGISERFIIKPHKSKCELHTWNLALSAQFFIYHVTCWALFVCLSIYSVWVIISCHLLIFFVIMFFFKKDLVFNRGVLSCLVVCKQTSFLTPMCLPLKK